MKKIISSILCLAMMLSMSTAAFAQTNDFVLTYSNEASYEIVIPEGSNIDVSTGKSAINIGIGDANLAEGTAVSVTVSSANFEDDTWYLVNTKDDSDKIAYSIGTTNGGNDIMNGSSVLSANSATDATLYVTVSDTSRVGTFTDIITFTSEIVDLISFTFDNNTYYAEEGMTWQQWIDSTYNTNSDFSITSDYGQVGDGSFAIFDSNEVSQFGEDVLIDGMEYIITGEGLRC